MKAYLYKHNEIFMVNSNINEAWLVDAFNELFNKLLFSASISEQRIYQSFSIGNNTITSEPHIVKDLLLKKELPPFKFLICKN
jgi:hypothetical protein